MTNKEKLLKGLNDSQQLAVQTVNGVIRIGAVAGSGKTRVSVNRTAYMIQECNINPRNILLTTFTKKASQEMGKRLKSLLTATEEKALFCGTTHSFGYKVLASEYKAMNHHLKDFTRFGGLLDPSKWQTKKFLEDIQKSMLNDRSFDDIAKEHIRKTPIKVFLSVIGNAKNAGIDHVEFERLNAGTANSVGWTYIEFYKRYEQQKWFNRQIDFDDMLFLTVKLFREKPQILKRYQQQYTHILVDEAQDNNVLQYELVHMLAYPQYNVLFVGDDDQSMYKFRGASPEDFINLQKTYPNLIEIGLEYNYRSDQQILDVANRLIKYNTFRIVKEQKSGKNAEEHAKDKVVHYSNFADEREEADERVKEVKLLNEHYGSEYRDMTFLYRTNAQSQSIEHALIMNGIPYVIHGGMSFYDRKEVKDITAYLRLALNLNDIEAFDRVYNKPTRYIGEAFMAKIKSIKGGRFAACDKANLTPREKGAVSKFRQMVNEIKAGYEDIRKNNGDLGEIIDVIMRLGYQEFLKEDDINVDSEEDEAENEIITTLRAVVSNYDNIDDFINYMNLMTGKRKTGDDINGVQLMTIHRSKGLEFPIVFIVGVNEGRLPHFRAVQAAEEKEDDAPIQEERRLAYVAATRPERRLFLSSTDCYNGKPCFPSRFLKEMELEDDNADADSEEEIKEEATA